MKFPLSWLKTHLDTTASADEIAVKLTAIGHEVEGVEDRAAALKGFVVGHVLSAEKHPDADKLQCLVVDTGTEKLKVVCGAPNARLGLKGVFAPSGSYIPGLDVTLKKANIRGQESNGMMCSERELLLSEEHNGIIELPADAVVGSSAADALRLNDPVIEVSVTPNRGDCTGVYGLARDLAASGLGKLKPLKADVVKGASKNPVSVTIKDENSCPHFIGRYIKGVKNTPAPQWLQDGLKASAQKSISALVDVTNYFSLHFSRPLHVFDADKLKGNIHTRLSKKGETMEALDGKTYTLEDSMAVVCDDSGVVALAGIIGGMSTAVDLNTKNVYLECAYFNPEVIARAGQKLQINSDARYRFERGINPAYTTPGAEAATQMIIDLCGGEASEIFVAGKAPDITREIAFDPAYAKKLGGSDLSETRQKEILTSLGFTLNGKSARTPAWRHDVMGRADLVEEVLRIDGYDNIPALAVRRPMGESLEVQSPLKKRETAARLTLAARGLNEAVTWAFMDSNDADLFGIQNKEALTLTNPISADLSVMRPSILPNLIQAAGRNADRALHDAALFEIGGVYVSPENNGQHTVAAGLRTNNAAPRHWSHPARAADVFDAKADAIAALEACGINASSLQIGTDAPSWYHPGRSGTLKIGKETVAHFGEIHPATLEKLKRDGAHAGFEIFLSSIPAQKKKGTQKALLKPSPFQPLKRDFAFTVDAGVEAEKILRAVKSAERNLITAVDIFDVYAGKGVEPGKKSVALSVTLQPQAKTLTDAEIVAVSEAIVASVAKATGGTIR